MERDRQIELWGDQSGNSLTDWMCILTEEVGEMAQECLHVHFGSKDDLSLKVEAVQVMAVAAAILESLKEEI